MKVTDKKIEELIPYQKNPRKNDRAVDKVAASIKEFGFKVPIVIDKNNVIVAGHTRLKAAEKLGMKKVPCITADDLNAEQIKAFRLADNKTSEFSEWDLMVLDEELFEISDIDMSQFGFDISVISEEPEIDEDPEEEIEIEKLEKHYGVPYQGNKSRIADVIISMLPEGNRLVDLFGGGGAITHCAMLSGKWESFLYNDLNKMITGLFLDAVNGKYHEERRVITREDFNSLKDTDAYVKYIWSFGNNGLAYLWGKEIEEAKCTACHFLLDQELTERRLAYRKFIRLLQEKNLTTPPRLQAVESLQALTQLEALQRLEVTNFDYTKYKHKDGDVVYCDVPYEQAGKARCDDYGVNFDSLAFYEWAKSQPYQIYFSSYEISDKSFSRKKVKEIQSLIGAKTNAKKVNEYLYSNRPMK